MVRRTSYTLRARKPDLTGAEVVKNWTGKLTEDYGMPNTLVVNARTAALDTIADAGAGCMLEDNTGMRFSGPLTSFTLRGNGTCTLTFSSDLVHLWDRDCYPNPALAFEAQDVDYDQRTGPAETVILGLIDDNAGPSALTDRRIPGLIIPTDLGRGGTTPVTARFDNLGQLVKDIAEAAGLRVDVRQVGTTRHVEVTVPPDLSAWARYGTPKSGGQGVLSEDWTMTVAAPTMTGALVGGGGEGAKRVLRERHDSDAETLWGRRIEAFVDQRGTTDTADLDKAGDDAVADGAKPLEAGVPVPDLPTMRLGIDVPLGARVGLDLGPLPLVDRLRQITTEIGSDRVKVSGVVGSSDAGVSRDQKQYLKLRKSLRKVQAS